MIKRFKHKARMLRDDPHMQEVARGTMLAFVLKVTGSGLAFGFNVAIARLLGAEGAGLYFLALSVTAVGSVIGRVGLDNTLLRFVATHATHDEWDKVQAVHALGMRLAVTVAGALSLIGFFAAGWMAEALFHKPELADPLRWMSLSILPFAMLNLQAESLKGLKRIRDAMLLQSIGVPLIGLLLIWPLANVAGVEGVSWGYLAATSMVALLGIRAWHSSKENDSNIVSAIPSYPFRTLWASCRHLWGVALLNGAILPWLPLFLLGVWSTSEEVGVFGAALRVAMLVSFFLGAVINVVAPKFVSFYVDGDLGALGVVARRSALLLTALASPVVLPMIFASDFVMLLFGDEFVIGAGVLTILSFGQLVGALCGPVGNLLIMSGYEQKLRNATVISFVLQLVLCVSLIPHMGMVGAAIAATGAVIINNVIAAYYVRRFIGIAYPIKIGGAGV